MIKKFISSICALALLIASAQSCFVFADDKIINSESVNSSENKGALSNQDLFKKYFETAKNYLNQGCDDLAIKELSKAIELDPKNTNAYNLRAGAYTRTGNNIRAISDYTKLIQLSPNDACAYSDRGFVYYEIGRNNEASADFKKASVLNPEMSIAMQGDISATKQVCKIPNTKKAKPIAIAKLPNKTNVEQACKIPNKKGTSKKTNQLTLAKLHNQSSAKVIKISKISNLNYKQAGIKKPSINYEINKNIAQNQTTLPNEKNTQNISIFKKLSGLFTTKRVIATNELKVQTPPVAKVVLMQKPLSQELKQAIEKPQLQKLNHEAAYIQKHIERGIEFSNTGEFEKAKNEFSKAIRRNPNDPELYILRSDAYLGVGDRKKALVNIEKALQLKPDHKAALAKHFEIVFAIEKEFRQKTLQDAVSCIKIDPANSRYYKIAGNIYFQENNYFAAITCAILYLKTETFNKISSLLKIFVINK